MSILSERLKTLRENKGVTQKEIADYLGISRGAYTMYETDRSEPKPERLERIAKYFSVSVEHLTGDDLDKVDVIIQKLIDLTKDKKIKWEIVQKKAKTNITFNDSLHGILKHIQKYNEYDYAKSFVFIDEPNYYLIMRNNDPFEQNIFIVSSVNIITDLLNVATMDIDIYFLVNDLEKMQIIKLLEVIKESNMTDEMKKQEQNFNTLIEGLNKFL